MTTGLWFAAAPEVHSALLSTGPGPGPVLAAAAAWNELSAHYREAAIELQHLLTTVQAGFWEGPSADQYIASHQTYLDWLLGAATVSAATAARLEEVASAYLIAVADMPALADLALNHTTHATLVGTNFFGINTIPIAINEADYARMWIQAATTMTVYDRIAGAALAATPQLPPAPPILTVESLSAATVANPAQAQAARTGAALDGAQSTVPDLIEDLFRSLLPAPFWQVIDELNALSIGEILNLLATNPAAAFSALAPLVGALLALGQFVATSILLWILQIGSVLLFFGASIALPLAIALSDPSRLTLPTDLVPMPAAVGAAVPTTARSTVTVTLVAPTSAPISATTSTPTITPPTSSPAAPTAPTGTAGPMFYAVGGADPEPPDRPTVSGGEEAPASHGAASALSSGVTPTDATRFRKRRRRRQDDADPARMHFREYLDDPPPEPGNRFAINTLGARTVSSGSDRGAGVMGRSGAVDHRKSHARGFIRIDSPVAGDEGMPSSRPLIPGTWPPPDVTH